MSREIVVRREGGIGLLGCLFVVFLTMKLVGIEPVASWSWWWIFGPLWIPAALVICIMLLVFAIAAVHR